MKKEVIYKIVNETTPFFVGGMSGFLIGLVLSFDPYVLAGSLFVAGASVAWGFSKYLLSGDKIARSIIENKEKDKLRRFEAKVKLFSGNVSLFYPSKHDLYKDYSTIVNKILKDYSKNNYLNQKLFDMSELAFKEFQKALEYNLIFSNKKYPNKIGSSLRISVPPVTKEKAKGSRNQCLKNIKSFVKNAERFFDESQNNQVDSSQKFVNMNEELESLLDAKEKLSLELNSDFELEKE